MELIDKFRNLMVMAAADGSLTEREVGFLSERSQKWNLSDDQVAGAIEYALSDEACLEIPPGSEERIEMLRDLIRMMAADGELAEIEKQLFATAAARMKISDVELNRIIDSVLY